MLTLRNIFNHILYDSIIIVIKEIHQVNKFIKKKLTQPTIIMLSSKPLSETFQKQKSSYLKSESTSKNAKRQWPSGGLLISLLNGPKTAFLNVNWLKRSMSIRQKMRPSLGPCSERTRRTKWTNSLHLDQRDRTHQVHSVMKSIETKEDLSTFEFANGSSIY